ncbi:hypothetical protein D3C77_425050 [compost metagenome]
MSLDEMKKWSDTAKTMLNTTLIMINCRIELASDTISCSGTCPIILQPVALETEVKINLGLPLVEST